MRDANASRSPASEFADEADRHRDDAVAQVDDCANFTCRQEVESREDSEVAVQFGIGPQCDLQTAEELGRRPQRVPFGNVRGYGEGCPTDLVYEREMSTQLRAQGKQVRLVGELLSTAPSVETLEFPHAREHVLGDGRQRYPIAADRCGFHASRISHLASRV